MRGGRPVRCFSAYLGPMRNAVRREARNILIAGTMKKMRNILYAGLDIV
jgi:hypothetical protein